jgi:hypothetical protein
MVILLTIHDFLPQLRQQVLVLRLREEIRLLFKRVNFMDMEISLFSST